MAGPDDVTFWGLARGSQVWLLEIQTKIKVGNPSSQGFFVFCCHHWQNNKVSSKIRRWYFLDMLCCGSSLISSSPSVLFSKGPVHLPSPVGLLLIFPAPEPGHYLPLQEVCLHSRHPTRCSSFVLGETLHAIGSFTHVLCFCCVACLLHARWPPRGRGHSLSSRFPTAWLPCQAHSRQWVNDCRGNELR